MPVLFGSFLLLTGVGLIICGAVKLSRLSDINDAHFKRMREQLSRVPTTKIPPLNYGTPVSFIAIGFTMISISIALFLIG